MDNNAKNTESVTKKIFVNGRVVGFVFQDLFIKRVVGSKHFLRSPRAIAFDVQSLEDAEQCGAKTIMVVDCENGTEYFASIDLVRTRGFTLDRGFGKQIALPMHNWSHTMPEFAGRINI